MIYCHVAVMYQVLLENALCFALSQMMTHHQNTHGFPSTRKHMRDLRVVVGNLGKIISKPTSCMKSQLAKKQRIYSK